MALIPFGSFLAGAIAPLTHRVLVALGLGILTYGGVAIAIATLIQLAKAHYLGLPSMVLDLAGLGGIGQAAGIVTGAVIYRSSITTLSKIGRVT